MPRLPISTVALLALIACGGSDEEPTFGACYVAAEDPAFTITSVSDARTGATIPVVTLADLSFSGTSYVPLALPGAAKNTRIVGTGLECTTPCGFTETPGAYTFTISAPGFAASSVTAVGSYSKKVGGCPLIYSGGAQVSYSLAPL